MTLEDAIEQAERLRQDLLDKNYLEEQYAARPDKYRSMPFSQWLQTCFSRFNRLAHKLGAALKKANNQFVLIDDEPTRKQPVTIAGVSVGTMAFMSPEEQKQLLAHLSKKDRH